MQIADMPPSTASATPFTKIESHDERDSITAAISSDCPRDQGFEHLLRLLGENFFLHRCGDRPQAQHEQTEEQLSSSGSKRSLTDLAHFAMLSCGNCWPSVAGNPEPTCLTGGACILLTRGTSFVLRDSLQTRPRRSFCEVASKSVGHVAHYGGGGAPTTIVCRSLSFDRASLEPVMQLALHNTMQALASEMAEQAPGSEAVATRLGEVLFIQAPRAHLASGVETHTLRIRHTL